MNPYGYGNSYMQFNPTQARLDSLTQQKQMIEQQIAQLTAPSPVNINLNQSPQPQQQQVNPFNQSAGFDFNGRYVDGLEEAKKESAQNLPIVFIDKNNPKLYLKNMDGTLKVYKLEEVQEEAQDDEVHNRIGALEGSIASIQAQMNQLINVLTSAPQPQPQAQTKASEPGTKTVSSETKSQARKKAGES